MSNGQQACQGGAGRGPRGARGVIPSHDAAAPARGARRAAAAGFSITGQPSASFRTGYCVF
jgi:hypothetical protein